MATNSTRTSSRTSNGSALSSRPALWSPRPRWCAPAPSWTAATPRGSALLRSCVEEREFNPKEREDPVPSRFRELRSSVLGWSFSAKGYAGTDESRFLPSSSCPARLRRDPAARLRRARTRAEGRRRSLAASRPASSTRAMTSTASLQQGKTGSLAARPHGTPPAPDGSCRRPALQRTLLRLISAPRGESSGWLDFRVAEMIQTAGRPISTALRLLLGQPRLLALPRDKRLAALLEDSRKYQNEVSERLAEQVLHGLYELLRGFQSAHDATKGELLHQQMAEHPDEVYRAMLDRHPSAGLPALRRRAGHAAR